MRIFLIAGKAGSGKNVVAKLIKEYYIYKVEECAITSYSKYIKNFALELTDWDGTDANKPRDFMQHLGDVMRELDEDFLVSNMIKDITIYQKYVELVRARKAASKAQANVEKIKANKEVKEAKKALEQEI